MPKPRTLLIAFLVFAGLDTALMIMFWELEGNPLLLSIGPYWATAVKLAATGTVVAIWNRWEMERLRPRRVAAGTLAVMYGAVVLTNLFVVVA